MVSDEFLSLEFNSKNLPKINHIIELIMLLCRKHWTLDTQGQEWLRFLDFLKDLQGKKPSEEIIRTIFSNIFVEFANNVPLKVFLENIVGKYRYLSMRDVKQVFLQLFSNYCYERNIIYNASYIVREEIMEKNLDFSHKNVIY